VTLSSKKDEDALQGKNPISESFPQGKHGWSDSHRTRAVEDSVLRGERSYLHAQETGTIKSTLGRKGSMSQEGRERIGEIRVRVPPGNGKDAGKCSFS